MSKLILNNREVAAAPELACAAVDACADRPERQGERLFLLRLPKVE